jgi:hypothetical protein
MELAKTPSEGRNEHALAQNRPGGWIGACFISACNATVTYEPEHRRLSGPLLDKLQTLGISRNAASDHPIEQRIESSTIDIGDLVQVTLPSGAQYNGRAVKKTGQKLLSKRLASRSSAPPEAIRECSTWTISSWLERPHLKRRTRCSSASLRIETSTARQLPIGEQLLFCVFYIVADNVE